MITRRRLLDFARLHPRAAQPLDDWYRVMKHSEFANPAELKAAFGSADLLGRNVAVFNIGGNKYRISASVRYAAGRIYVRHVMTHDEYDRRSAAGTL